MGQVAAVNTPATPGQILGAILSTGLSETAARMLLAHSAFETGGWAKGFWDWNLGNITASGTMDYQMLPGDPDHLKYRVYSSLQAGAADFVTFLNNRGLVAVANTGSLAAYVARLKAIGYATSLNTASGYASYQNGMAGWLGRLASVTPQNVPFFQTLQYQFARSPAAYVGAAGIIGGAVWAFYGIREGRIRF